jgi:hypothetical protein
MARLKAVPFHGSAFFRGLDADLGLPALLEDFWGCA